MARVALPSTWAGALMRQRGSLRTYQWLWIALCTASALLAAAPRILSQPVLYQAAAETRFDPAIYRTLYNAAGVPSADFAIATNDATNAQLQKSRARRENRFGAPTYRVDFLPQTAGVVRVQSTAPTSAEAQALANQGAEELTRQIQAAGGRDILRTMLNWQIYEVFRRVPPATPFDALLRKIAEDRAFPLSIEIESSAERHTLDELQRDDQSYLARAFEARYDLWQFEINTRNATLDAWCQTDALTTTKAREEALKTCAATQPHVGEELKARNSAIGRLQTVAEAMQYLVEERKLTFAPDTAGAPVYRIVAPAPESPLPRRIPELLALAAMIGLVLGAGGVAVDRSANLMRKARELWAYRELIRNLVLRDLRVRYKGSALGYLWTQIAPLLLMLIFLFVFSVLMPNGIALFPVFLLVGLLPWNFCAEAINSATRSIIDNANLIKKVFFPREVLPLVSVLSALINYVLSLPMMLLVMAVAQLLYPPLGRLNFAWTFAYLPVVIMIETLLLFGLALFLSALAVFFRDMVHLIGILIQFWFFLTPVVYSLDSIHVPDRTGRLIRWLNPMASIIEFYRETLYGRAVDYGNIPTPGLPALDSVLRVLITSIIVLALGYWFFQRQSGRFGEEI